MVSYLTPAAFRVMGTGVNVSAYSDLELWSVLNGASARVNAFCSAPTLPQEHDFRGGVISNERHNWNLNGQRRFYPWHQPVKTINQFRILVTEANYISVATDQIFINNSAGYGEVVALTLGVGIFPVIASLNISQPVSQIGYTYGRSFPVTGETLYESDGQTFRAANQWWDTSVTPVIYINGSAVTSNFTIDRNEGTATHTAGELDASDVVTADYAYTLPSAISRATAVIAVEMLGKARVAARDMIGVGSLRIAPGEVEISPIVQRPMRTDGWLVPDEAALLLAPYVFR